MSVLLPVVSNLISLMMFTSSFDVFTIQHMRVVHKSEAKKNREVFFPAVSSPDPGEIATKPRVLCSGQFLFVWQNWSENWSVFRKL